MQIARLETRPTVYKAARASSTPSTNPRPEHAGFSTFVADLKPERLEPAVKVAKFAGNHQPRASVDAVIEHVLASLVGTLDVL